MVQTEDNQKESWRNSNIIPTDGITNGPSWKLKGKDTSV